MKVNLGKIMEHEFTPFRMNKLISDIEKALIRVQDVKEQDTIYRTKSNILTAGLNAASHTETAHASTSDPWTGGNTCIYSGGAVTFTDIADAPSIGAVRTIIPQAGDVWTDGAVFDVNDGSNYTCVAGDVLRLEAVTLSTFRVSTITRAALIAPTAFGAGLSSDQTITTATFTKVQLDTEEFDLGGYYDNVTNYRYTPLVEGYYQFNFSGSSIPSTGTVSRTIVQIYKNGASVKRGGDLGAGIAGYGVTGAALVYMNGSTDYVELWMYITAATAAKIWGSPVLTYLNGFLARAV
jgi:hypothetical protein